MPKIKGATRYKVYEIIKANAKRGKMLVTASKLAEIVKKECGHVISRGCIEKIRREMGLKPLVEKDGSSLSRGGSGKALAELTERFNALEEKINGLVPKVDELLKQQGGGNG